VTVSVAAYTFAALFLLGLVLGVRAMLQGVERPGKSSGSPRFAINGPMVAGFAAVCGATGYLLTRYTRLSTPIDLVIALPAGVLGALGALSLVAAWAIPAAQAEVVDERFTLQGAFARVVAAAEGGATGTIRYEVDGVAQTSPASPLDNSRLEVGADVVIERIENGVAFVEPWARVEARL
jgi:hypothetical protein